MHTCKHIPQLGFRIILLLNVKAKMLLHYHYPQNTKIVTTEMRKINVQDISVAVASLHTSTNSHYFPTHSTGFRRFALSKVKIIINV